MSTHHIFADPDNVNILEAAVTPPGEKCACEESLVHILVVTQSIADISQRQRIENAKCWLLCREFTHFLVYFYRLPK